MKITIEIECDNDAFMPHAGLEVIRILSDLTDSLGGTAKAIRREDGRHLMDKNGNAVGCVTVTE